MPEKQAQLGFSLKGLIVILLICLFLLGLLIPAILDAREKARQANCMNNLKQIGLVLHNCYDARHYFPGSAELVRDGDKKKAGGWSFLFKSSNCEYDNDTPMNKLNPSLIKKTISLKEQNLLDPLTDTDPGLENVRDWHITEFLCPSNPNKTYEDPANKKIAFTNYKAMGATSMESLLLCVDPDSPPPYGSASQHPDGAIFPGDKGISISRDIMDGTACTIMVAETIDDTKSAWIAGSDVTLVGMPKANIEKWKDAFFAPAGYNGEYMEHASPTIRALRSYTAFDFRPGHTDAGTYPAGVGRTPAYGPSSGHPDIVNHLFCDGSVRSIRKDVDYAAYFFAITRNNSDPGDDGSGP